MSSTKYEQIRDGWRFVISGGMWSMRNGESFEFGSNPKLMSAGQKTIGFFQTEQGKRLLSRHLSFEECSTVNVDIRIKIDTDSSSKKLSHIDIDALNEYYVDMN